VSLAELEALLTDDVLAAQQEFERGETCA